jgi:tetrapyrrole methylase family protein/MazG family protein
MPPLSPPDPSLPGLDQLCAIVAALRGPGGCPWDREQTHASLRAGLLEEAYEVAAAIDSGDDANLREELGDLLLQVVFHARIAEEEGRFAFDGVALDVAQKLVRRHPHVFADESAADSAEVLVRWEEIKRQEKGGNGERGEESLLDGVLPGLPALQYAAKIQKRTAKVGFDWKEMPPVLAKVREELAEVEADLEAGLPLEKELGDLLFAVVNLARKAGVDAEVALSGATRKFERRFRGVETLARQRALDMAGSSLEELDRLWDEVKAAETPGDTAH